MTPLPVSTAPAMQSSPLRARGFGAEPYARRLAFAPDGSGDVVFSVGKSYLSARTLFHFAADASGVLSDTATALLALPEEVRGLPEVRAVSGLGDYVVGAVNWHDEAAARFAYADLYRVSADGERAVSLTSGLYRINDFAVSPGGERVALLLWDGRLLSLELSTGLTRTLASDVVSPAGIAAATLAWSPEGQSLVVGSHPDPTGARLERFDAATGHRELLVDLPGRHQPVPIYLADGRLLVVVHDSVLGGGGGLDYRARLYAVDDDFGGSLRHLHDLTGPQGLPDVVRELTLHPAGTSMLYRLDGVAWMVDGNGGAPHRLSDPGATVTAGPDVSRTLQAGDRVAWIERVPLIGGSADQPIVGGPTPLAWRVRGAVLP
jgi:dipeptidyl aminopeptidase/acylaminoacyl peptidase